MIICSPELSLEPESNSGGVVYERNILRELCKLGAEVHVILPRGSKYDKAKGLHVHRLSFPSKHIWPWSFNFLELHSLFKLVGEYKFDVVRCSPYFVAPGCILLKKILRCKSQVLVTYYHLERGRIPAKIDSYVTGSADKIIAISKSTASQLMSTYGVPEEKIDIIYPGVDVNKFKPNEKNFKLFENLDLTNRKVLLFIGPLIERKGVQYLIKALPLVLKEKKDIKLIIGSEGPYKKYLEKLATDLKVTPYVKFVGFIPSNLIVEYYNIADVFISPSLLEGFGLTVAEAMACGKPVIGSDIGGINEIIRNKKTGILIPPKNSRALAEAILELISNEELRVKYGKASRKRVEKHFTWKRAAEETLKVYNPL